jgi:putative ABC transport system permease protein
MIAVALRNVRHRPGGFVATLLSSFLGAALLMAFASLVDTAAAGSDPASADSLTTTAGVGGGWCLIIVGFAVTSTLTLAVRQRAEQITALRRIGATQRQLRRMVVAEAAAVALAASALAVPAGLLLGRVLLTLMRNTGQVAGSVRYTFGPVALGVGFGVTLLGSVVAGFASARRAARPVSPRERPWRRRIWAVVFLLIGANCAVLQTAGQAGIWAAVGLALLAPELLRLVTAALGPVVGRLGAPGELAVTGVHQRNRQLAGTVMPVVLFSGIATGTVYMQDIENTAAAGVAQPDYAQDVKTLNYVVVGMITVFVAVMLVNTIIAATTHRRREFAQQRLAGSTRGQLMAMVALEGLLASVTGVLAGTAAALFTVLPFGSARVDHVWPDAPPGPYAIIIAVAVGLAGAAMLATARRTVRGPAVQSLA